LFGPHETSSRVLEEVFEDAPGGRHHLQRMGPDLEIIRRHEILGDAGTENRINPILKVVAGQATLLSLNDAQNALMEYLWGQAVARETNVSIARLTEWRERALAGAATALKERDDRDDEIARLKSKVGEITMDNELLYAKIEALEGKRPLAHRRSRR
jgi:hypothetical protein